MYHGKAIDDGYPYHCIFYKVQEKYPEDGDLIGDGNEDSSDGDLLGDDDEATASSETTEEQEATDTENADETETTSTEIILLKTECDIQKVSKLYSSGVILADYKVLFSEEGVGRKLPFTVGDKFRCDDYSTPLQQGVVRGISHNPPFGHEIEVRITSFSE